MVIKLARKMELTMKRAKKTSGSSGQRHVAAASTSRKRDRISTENRLIDAGTAVFSKFGYDGATTKSIAKAADVNESLIIRYFNGKEGLLLEIIKRFLQKWQLETLDYPEQETLEKEMLAYVRHLFKNVQRDIELYRIMILRASLDPGIRKKINKLLPSRGDTRLRSRLDSLAGKGKIPRHVSADCLQLIGFQVFSTLFVTHMLLERDQNEMMTQVEDLTRACIHGLVHRS